MKPVSRHVLSPAAYAEVMATYYSAVARLATASVQEMPNSTLEPLARDVQTLSRVLALDTYQQCADLDRALDTATLAVQAVADDSAICAHCGALVMDATATVCADCARWTASKSDNGDMAVTL